MGGDEHVVGGGDEQGRAGGAGPKLESSRRRDPPFQGRNRRKALQLVLGFDVQHARIHRAPPGRIEEYRLGLDIGFRAARPKQLQADVEAALRVRVEPRPAVDDDPPGQGAAKLEPDQTADRMAQEIGAADFERVHQREDVCRHRSDRHLTFVKRPAPAGSTMVVEEDAMVLRQRRQVRSPIGARAAEAGREDQDRAVLPAVPFVPEAGGMGHQPICATLAISTRRPGFTRPHWMQ